MTAKQFQPIAEQVFMQMTSNTGATDAERISNFAAFTDAQMYAVVAQQFADNASLISVEFHRSSLSNTRTVLKLSLGFADQKTGVMRKFCADFDATDKHPFKAKMWEHCYDC